MWSKLWRLVKEACNDIVKYGIGILGLFFTTILLMPLIIGGGAIFWCVAISSCVLIIVFVILLSVALELVWGFFLCA